MFLRVLLVFLMPLFSCNQGPEEFIAETPLGGNYERYFKGTPTQNKPRIIIVSHSTLDVPYLAPYTWPNHHAYAKEIGVDYWFRNGTIDNGKFFNKNNANKIFHFGLYWQKIQAVQDALNLKDGSKRRYEYVFWIDPDAYFVSKKSIWNLIADVQDKTGINPNFLIAGDPSSCVNAGVFLVRNNDIGRKLIQDVADSFSQYKDKDWPEQLSIQDFIYGFAKNIQGKTLVTKEEEVKQRSCNYNNDSFKNKTIPYEIINRDKKYIRADPWIMNAWYQAKEVYGNDPVGKAMWNGFVAREDSLVIHTPGIPDKMKAAEQIRLELNQKGILKY